MKATVRTRRLIKRRGVALLAIAIASAFAMAQPGSTRTASAAASAAGQSAAALRARGAVEMPSVGSLSFRVNTPCPDGQVGCYGIVTGQHGSATLVNGQPVSLVGSGVYTANYSQYNTFGVWQYTEKLSASDWWNGSGAGQYWVSNSHNLGLFWQEPNAQSSGFWDGGQWAWTNWANDTEYYQFGAYNYTMFTYLRIYVQPNGSWWVWTGH